jgi:hypothetical protein
MDLPCPSSNMANGKSIVALKRHAQEFTHCQATRDHKYDGHGMDRFLI